MLGKVGRMLDKVFREPVTRPGSGRYAPRMFKPLPALILITITATVLGWVLFAALARLSGSDVPWLWPQIGDVPKTDLFDIVRSAATVAALIGGLFAILYAYRKQRVEEAAGHRADAETLSKRYQDAAEQLGHTAAAVRLAGAYALARLADEWEDQRQSCVDVLCACLRMGPQMADQRVNDGEHSVYLPDDGDMQVRRTISELITGRLTSNGLWSACDFNLTGAHLVDFKVRNASVGGQFIMNRATLAGDCDLTRTTFNGGLDAIELRIEGTLKLADVLPGPSKTISLTDAYIDKGGTLDFVVREPPKAGTPWLVWPKNITCYGTFALKMAKTSYEQATLHISGLDLQPNSVFQMDQVPAKAKSDSFLPSIAADQWLTTSSTEVVVPGVFRKKNVFKAAGWKGAPVPQFKYAYVDEPNIDTILASGPGA